MSMLLITPENHLAVIVEGQNFTIVFDKKEKIEVKVGRVQNCKFVDFFKLPDVDIAHVRNVSKGKVKLNSTFSKSVSEEMMTIYSKNFHII